MKFYFYTLGCPKNEVDTEHFASKLEGAGHTPVQNPQNADYILINTCAFIKDAIVESMETYEKLAQEFGKDRVIITGCLVERAKFNLKNRLFIRPDDVGMIDDVVNGGYTPLFLHKQKFIYNGERTILDELPYSYVKIQEGCSRKCTFCTIPSIRGKPRYRTIPSIVREVKELVNNKKSEIILVGEDLTLYKELIRLLDELSKVRGLKLIRLLYLHPQGIKKELILYVKNNPKIARYFHIPIQHVNNRILKLMGRSGGERAVRKSVELVRTILPQAFIRTEIMVGFPTETEEEFNDILTFIEREHIERIGVFKYSREEGTKSFSLSQIDRETKEERYERASLLAQLVMEKAQKRLHKKKVRVIADTRNTGRTEYDAPNSDFNVTFKVPLKKGSIRKKILYYNDNTTLLAI